MKVLYAIQGTGNGHVTRARDIVPLLQKYCDVDVLISGRQADVSVPFPVKYRYQGLGFVFGKKGGIDMLETFKRNSIKTLFNEINSLPVEEYDLVINDFEPVSAWACYQKNKKCIGLSHQAAVLNKNAPQGKNVDPVGRAILKKYAPVDHSYGFHFKQYDEHIYLPVIRGEIRQQRTTNIGHYTVYLPAYDDKRILKVLKHCKDVRYEVFSKHNKKPSKHNNITIQPINNEAFIASMASCTGVICGAGFETPAEALYMRKKLLVVPMKGQYEQQCNAAALKEMGVPVLKSFKKKNVEKIDRWIKSGETIKVDYPDMTEDIIQSILADYSDNIDIEALQPGKKVYSEKKFRKVILQKIVAHF